VIFKNITNLSGFIFQIQKTHSLDWNSGHCLPNNKVDRQNGMSNHLFTPPYLISNVRNQLNVAVQDNTHKNRYKIFGVPGNILTSKSK
jgi:hypothetical protein